MKSEMNLLSIVTCYLVLFCFISCERPTPKSNLKDLTTLIGMSFPQDTVLLNEINDERGPDSMRAWGLKSANAFHIPAPEEFIIIKTDTTTVIDLVKLITREKNISNVSEALSGDWIHGEYMYRGMLVRSATGDYLAIEQFPSQ